jgi:hypothetical protein
VRRIELSVAVLITCSPAIARAADRLGPDLDARNPALVAERFTTTIHERVTAAGWRGEILIAPSRSRQARPAVCRSCPRTSSRIRSASATSRRSQARR